METISAEWDAPLHADIPQRCFDHSQESNSTLSTAYLEASAPHLFTDASQESTYTDGSASVQPTASTSVTSPTKKVTRGRPPAFSQATKDAAIEYAKTHTIVETAREFKVSSPLISYWIRKSQEAGNVPGRNTGERPKRGRPSLEKHNRAQPGHAIEPKDFSVKSKTTAAKPRKSQKMGNISLTARNVPPTNDMFPTITSTSMVGMVSRQLLVPKMEEIDPIPDSYNNHPCSSRVPSMPSIDDGETMASSVIRIKEELFEFDEELPERQEFNYSLSIDGYEEDEIKVDVDDGKIIIQGVHFESNDDEVIRNTLFRQIKIPSHINADSITASFTHDNHLLISGRSSRKRSVPIIKTPC